METARLIESWGGKFGISIVSTKTVTPSTQDLTADLVAGALQPRRLAKFLLGTANATALKQPRQAGFDGPVIATNSDAGRNIKGAGAAGAGTAWPSDFSSAQTDPAAAKFIEAYKARFNGGVPSLYAAEGYDAVRWLAHAVKRWAAQRPTTSSAG